MGLTSADIQELTWWFGAVPETNEISAQNYEASGSRTYDPFANTRLVALMLLSATPWQRVWGALRDCGRENFEILRRAFGFRLAVGAKPPFAGRYEYPEVA